MTMRKFINILEYNSKKSEEPETVEYEDMTDYQKRIVDAAESPPAGVIPHLSGDELEKWLKKTFGKK